MEPIVAIPTFTHESPSTLLPLLRSATAELSSRGLHSSAKWSAELLASLRPSPSSSSSDLPGPQYRTSTPVRMKGGREGREGRQSLPGLPPMFAIAQTRRDRDSLGSVMEMEGASSPVVAQPERMEEEEEDGEGEGGEEARREWDKRDDDEQDLYTLALAYYRVHEHLRAAHTLRDCTGPKARWLRNYAKFLAGDKKAQEENGDLLGVKDKGVLNPYSTSILTEMDGWEPGFIQSDGYLLFLKALLILSLPPLNPSTFTHQAPSASSETSDVRLLAIELLLESVKLQPYNWSAWLKLTACLEGSEELEGIIPFLPQVFTSSFFYVHTTLEMHAANPSLQMMLDRLADLFGECSTIKGLRALIHYHIREFDEASTYFAALRETDPYRIEDIDTYSNILYVSEKRAELAMLAQEYTKLDRSRPETCCLVGNYYSIRREHEKAILYFRRALKLDRAYLSAWTLMGHEYVEIKNTNAAIASYRRAVDVNRKDYRAWYGLGQTYELLGESYYALNYYQKATALRFVSSSPITR
ncbi:anaphase-promoting complex subunit 8, partial [Phenoliferia sp. Uapishka_3]